MKKLIGILFLTQSFSLWGAPDCKATYDDMGITHQNVENSREYYYCFGLHHGRDRAWQMDFFRRFAQGRNAEVLGFKQIKNDFIMRLLDIPSMAKKLYEDFAPEYQALLEDYSEGVNEGFKEGKGSDEFIKLGYSPEAWEPIHSVTVLLLQSFDQTKKTFFFDVKEQENLSHYANAQSLSDEGKTPWLTTILKDGEYKKSNVQTTYVPTHRESLKLWANFPELFGKNSGSNNWVLDKTHTLNQKAILANDPHLDLKTPMFWYWIQLKGKDHDAFGASLPGLPFIASGTNGKISWGLTNSYLNSADSVEITDLDEKDLLTSRPVIWFKFGFLKLPFFFRTITKFKEKYPLLPLEVPNRQKVFLRWSGHALKANELTPMFELFKMKNVKEADELLLKVGVPSWNFVFADIDGKIGYRMVGKTYQNEVDPFGVQKLTSKEFLNPTFIDGNDRPHVFESSRSFVVTANNQHWPEDSLYKGGGGYSLSFRANRIEEELLKNKKQTINNLKNIQCDLFVTDAKFFIPLIQKYIPNFLEDWNLIASDTSMELGVYRRLMDLMMESWHLNESGLYQFLVNLEEERIKELHSLYITALKDVNHREWAKMAFLPFEHLSGDSRFNYSPTLSALGDEHTVGPGTTKWIEDRAEYEHFSGASMRMIVEMSNPVKVFLSLPGLNRQYQVKGHASPWNEWRECRYFSVTL